MITRRSALHSLFGATLGAPFVAGTSHAQDAWPDRPIHTICMFPPGGGADIYVRFFAKKLQDVLGKIVIVENKVGAFGNLATEYVARSKGDGYTIYIAPGSSVFAAATHLFRKLPFDPINDFEHVTTLFKLPFILAVSADSPFKTVAQLTAYLEANGDKASYGSIAYPGLVGSELYKANFGLNTVEVKYKDVMPALADLYAGNISFMHIDPAGGAAPIKSGKIRPLAVTSAQRTQALPDIPGALETGITNSDLIAWWSVHTPKGTPRPILDRLETAFNEIAIAPDTKAFLANFGTDPFPGNAAMLKELLTKDSEAWGRYVRLAKIEPLS